MEARIWSKASVVIAVLAVILAPLVSPAAASDDIVEYPVSGGASDITAGPDGNMWFTQQVAASLLDSAGATALATSTQGVNAGKIGRITPRGAVTEYPLPTAYSDPMAIAAGRDGNLWFTETVYNPNWSPRILGHAIGRMTPEGTITEYPLSEGGGDYWGPQGIAAGPDGAMWFTTPITVGRITPDGTITQYTLPDGGNTGGIAAGPDGNVWFTTHDAFGPAIGRVTPDGAITRYPMPTGHTSDPSEIAAGRDGNMWFTEPYGARIGRITPDGTISEFPLSTKYAGQPQGIAAGPDGNMWFTEEPSVIGRITPDGTITHFKLPNYDSRPYGLAAGPDGNMWFTSYRTIGRISPTSTPIRKWTCPLTVTLHKPAPKKVGNRILTDRIKTNNFCVLPKPVVRCRSLTGTGAGNKADCNTKVTKRGAIKVNTKRYEAARVTVVASATPKNKPGFPGPWKRAIWRKTWVLR